MGELHAGTILLTILAGYLLCGYYFIRLCYFVWWKFPRVYGDEPVACDGCEATVYFAWPIFFIGWVLYTLLILVFSLIPKK